MRHVILIKIESPRLGITVPYQTARKLDKTYQPTVTSHWITRNECWWPLEMGANESSLYSCPGSPPKKSLERTTQGREPQMHIASPWLEEA